MDNSFSYFRNCVSLHSENSILKMRRKLYNSLIEWKNNSHRKPLILEGARQVGKTWLLKEFGKNEYENLVYVNCHDNPEVQQLFIQDLNVVRVMQAFEAYSGQRIVAGKTLIFIDEIQEAPHALESLKYFCENAPEQHVAVAGSLLGVMNRPEESYPVGKVNTLRLLPMSFEEFLWAQGADYLTDEMSHLNWQLMKDMDVKLQEHLRQYYYVGGMPEVVLHYTTQGDVNGVRRIQQEIIANYNHDFAKHAGKDTQRIRLVWDSIPSQLAKENKKFIYGAVKKGGRARELENAIQWLVDAGLVYKVYRAASPQVPLKFYRDIDAFKLYLLDVGLLGALSDAPAMQMLVTNDVFKEFKGSFSENYVLQQLTNVPSLPVYYYSKDNSRLEIDFLVQINDKVVPIEVKAEENVKGKSLAQFVKNEFGEEHLQGLRISMKPYIDQGWMENIPLYAVGFFFKQTMPE